MPIKALVITFTLGLGTLEEQYIITENYILCNEIKNLYQPEDTKEYILYDLKNKQIHEISKEKKAGQSKQWTPFLKQGNGKWWGQNFYLKR